MARFRVGLTSCALLMLFAAPSVWAQSLPLSSVPDIKKLSRPAGIIFSGVVVRIERERAENGKPAAMRIALRIDEAERGCYAGETIEIAEWSGLWVRSDRYRVGQKLFLFLYPRNKAGLTSPVAGDLGRFMLGSDGLLRLTSQQAELLNVRPGGHGSAHQLSRPARGRSVTQDVFTVEKLVARIREAE